MTHPRPMVFRSKHSWKPGDDGTQYHWEIGERVTLYGQTGTFFGTIKSDLMWHDEANYGKGGYVYEVLFDDDGQVAATDAFIIGPESKP